MSSSSIYSAVGSIGSVLTHPTIFVAMWKYIFQQGWSYSFYSLVFINAILFLVGIGYFFYKVKHYDDIRKTVFYLPGRDLLILSIAYGGYLIGTVFSLADEDMNAGRYLMLAPVHDFFWMGLWSSILLQRQLSIYHWISFLLALVGYAMYDIFEYKGEWEFNFEVKNRDNWTDWRGPLWASLARASYVLSGVLSKRFIMKRGFQIKLEAFEEEEKIKLMEKAKRRANDKRNPIEKLKAYQRNTVSKESMVYRRAMWQKREFLKKKREELQEIEENLEDATDKLNLKLEKIKEKKKIEKEAEQKERNINQRMYRKMKGLQDKAAKRDYDDINAFRSDLKEKDTKKEAEFLKRKEELQKALEEEESKNYELETLISDYEQLAFHMHLFSGMDDLTLSKIDYVMDNPTYDSDLIGITEQCTFELYGIGGALSLFPLSCFAAFMNQEIPEAFDQLTANDVGPFGDGSKGFIIVSIFSLLFALRPYFIHKMVYNTTHGFYFSLNVLSHFFVLAYSIIVVDQQDKVPSTQGAGLMISALAFGVFFVGINNQASVMQSISNMESLKTMLPLHEMNDEEIENLDLKMMEIQNVLGDQALLRIMLDTALSRNPNGLNYTGNPVLVTRVLFDKDYYHRVAEWGGGYPRPFVEAIEESWRAPAGKGIEIDDDEWDELVEEERIYKEKLERIRKRKEEERRKKEEAQRIEDERKRKIEEQAKKIFAAHDMNDEIEKILAGEEDVGEIKGNNAFDDGYEEGYKFDENKGVTTHTEGQDSQVRLTTLNGTKEDGVDIDGQGGRLEKDRHIPRPFAKLTPENLAKLNLDRPLDPEDEQTFEFRRLKKQDVDD